MLHKVQIAGRPKGSDHSIVILKPRRVVVPEKSNRLFGVLAVYRAPTGAYRTAIAVYRIRRIYRIVEQYIAP